MLLDRDGKFVVNVIGGILDGAHYHLDERWTEGSGWKPGGLDGKFLANPPMYVYHRTETEGPDLFLLKRRS
jgi:hypothetical protein